MSGALRRLLGRGIAAENRVLSTVPHAVITVDRAERLIYANPAGVGFLRSVFEPERSDVTGASLHDILQSIAPDGGRICALCAAAAADGEHDGEAFITVGEASHRVWYATAPLVERAEPVGLVVSLERRRTDAETERRTEERIAREMESLVADLAHELNNPLTVILAVSGMLRESTDVETTRRRVEMIGEAAERCVAIVRRFRSTFVPSQPPAPVPVAAASRQAPVLARAEVLVVDDDHLVATAMAAALAAEGHQVDIASDGADALSRVAVRTYDAIVTDVRMPRLDGPGLYRELGRVRPELRSRVVFVTGDMLSSSTRDFIESIGASVVRKPFEPRQLRTAVRKLLTDPARDSA